MGFCIKIFWFILGGSFFLCWPISSLYPKYRYLVSPFKRVLWDIPTHGMFSQTMFTIFALGEQKQPNGRFNTLDAKRKSYAKN